MGVASSFEPGAAALAALVPTGLTNAQQDVSLVWFLLIASIVGAGLTWGFLAYALWKFRDPATRGRRYG